MTKEDLQERIHWRLTAKVITAKQELSVMIAQRHDTSSVSLETQRLRVQAKINNLRVWREIAKRSGVTPGL